MRPSNHRTLFLLGVAAVSAALALPLVIIHDRGMWPSDWPAELEALRSRSRTLEIATGLRMDIHEITFQDREAFESAWPLLLQLKSDGASVTLYSRQGTPPEEWGSLLSNQDPAVRVYAPPLTSMSWNRLLAFSSFRSKNGEVPRYVHREIVDGREVWVPNAESQEVLGFSYRVRVELDLVVDGEVIDLDRISFPKGTPVIDKRDL